MTISVPRRETLCIIVILTFVSTIHLPLLRATLKHILLRATEILAKALFSSSILKAKDL